MVVQISEEPASSNNQPHCSKVESLKKLPEASENIAYLTPVAPVFHGQNRWTDWVTRILNRTDELGQTVKQFIAYLVAKIRVFFYGGDFNTYHDVPLSFESRALLESVPRKTLILDLDETLLHSCYLDPETNDFIGCNLVPETAVPDYEIEIPILPELPPIAFRVYKRPFVDAFLDVVDKWYDVVIYTASLESYATIVIDLLDAGRGILPRRYYRQHCISTTAAVSKNLSVVNKDLNSVIIIDNSPSAYKDFPKNAIPIKSYIYDPDDKELLNLLPFLDALRFTRDVRSILSRREVASIAYS